MTILVAVVIVAWEWYVVATSRPRGRTGVRHGEVIFLPPEIATVPETTETTP